MSLTESQTDRQTDKGAFLSSLSTEMPPLRGHLNKMTDKQKTEETSRRALVTSASVGPGTVSVIFVEFPRTSEND